MHRKQGLAQEKYALKIKKKIKSTPETQQMQENYASEKQVTQHASSLV